MKAAFSFALFIAIFALVEALHSPRNLPNPALTPGAVRVTEAMPTHAGCPTFYAMNAMAVPAECPGPVTEAEVCGSRGTARFRHTMGVTKASACKAYGITAADCHDFENDHLVPLELGGSDAHLNHFPEPWAGKWNARRKDWLENRMRQLVCVEREVAIDRAWTCFSGDWIACYGKVKKHDYDGIGRLK